VGEPNKNHEIAPTVIKQYKKIEADYATRKYNAVG
jgi:hypothetical protein